MKKSKKKRKRRKKKEEEEDDDGGDDDDNDADLQMTRVDGIVVRFSLYLYIRRMCSNRFVLLSS